MYEELKKLLKSTDIRWKQIVIKKNEIYKEFLNDLYPNVPLNQQIYLFEKDIPTQPKCPICGKDLFFHSYKKGYFRTCSHICNNKLLKLEGKLSSITEKRRHSNIEKYGVDNPMKNTDIKKKSRQTNLTRYNTEIASQRHILENTLNILNDKEKLSNLLKKHNSLTLGNLLGVSDVTISNYARKYGINSRYRSNLECSFYDWLDTLPYKFKTDKKILNGLEIDRYCEELKFGIEINGLYHHSERLKNKHYHNDKTLLAKHKGVMLIHIFEDEWYEKQDIVKNIILTHLGLTEKGKGARQLSLTTIDNKLANQFFNQYHIQGKTTGLQISIAAYDNDQLVAVMGFGHPTRQNTKYQYELKRYCTDHKTYAGLASKLFQYFVNEYDPHSIGTFSDNRWFTGKSYEIMGFKYDCNIPIDYMWTDNIKRYNKTSFRKQSIKQKFNLTDDMIHQHSERELMESFGYYRIWNCGRKRFIWESINI